MLAAAQFTPDAWAQVAVSLWLAVSRPSLLRLQLGCNVSSAGPVLVRLP